MANASDVIDSRQTPAVTLLNDHTHWVLRLALASVFGFHGLQKLPALEPMSQMLGFSEGVILLVALAEIATAVFIIAGGLFGDWLTRLGALLGMPVILGAIAFYHWPRWSFTPADGFPMGGMEFQVTLLFLLIYFLARKIESQGPSS